MLPTRCPSSAPGLLLCCRKRPFWEPPACTLSTLLLLRPTGPRPRYLIAAGTAGKRHAAAPADRWRKRSQGLNIGSTTRCVWLAEPCCWCRANLAITTANPPNQPACPSTPASYGATRHGCASCCLLRNHPQPPFSECQGCPHLMAHAAHMNARCLYRVAGCIHVIATGVCCLWHATAS